MRVYLCLWLNARVPTCADVLGKEKSSWGATELSSKQPGDKTGV